MRSGARAPPPSSRRVRSRDRHRRLRETVVVAHEHHTPRVRKTTVGLGSRPPPRVTNPRDTSASQSTLRYAPGRTDLAGTARQTRRGVVGGRADGVDGTTRATPAVGDGLPDRGVAGRGRDRRDGRRAHPADPDRRLGTPPAVPRDDVGRTGTVPRLRRECRPEPHLPRVRPRPVRQRPRRQHPTPPGGRPPAPPRPNRLRHRVDVGRVDPGVGRRVVRTERPPRRPEGDGDDHARRPRVSPRGPPRRRPRRRADGDDGRRRAAVRRPNVLRVDRQRRQRRVRRPDGRHPRGRRGAVRGRDRPTRPPDRVAR